MYTKLILLNPISNPIKNPTGAMVLIHESVGIIGLPRVTKRLSCSLNSAGHCSPAFASTHCIKNWHDVYRRGAGNPFLLKIALLYSANEALNKNHEVAKHVHFMYSHFVSRSIIFCTYAVDTFFSPFSSALFSSLCSLFFFVDDDPPLLLSSTSSSSYRHHHHPKEERR